MCNLSYSITFLFLVYNNLSPKQQLSISFNDYDGKILKYDKICHYLENQRPILAPKIEKIFSPYNNPVWDQKETLKHYSLIDIEQDQQKNQRKRMEQDAKQKFFNEKRRKSSARSNVFDQLSFNKMQQKNIGLEKLYDRYNYKQKTKKDYITLPDDPNFQNLLSSQNSLIQQSQKRLSPQNQDKLIFAFRQIYQKLLDTSPKRSLS